MTEARENPTRPFVGVGAVVISGNAVLLIRRGKPPKHGEWSLPGGGQKLGETTAEATCREVAEETGMAIELLEILDVIDFIEKDDQGNILFHYTLIDYLARPLSGTPQAGSDALEAKFFPLAEALSLPLWKETHRVIRLAEDRIKQIEGNGPS